MSKYKVKRGETLSQIAERMGIPESQLRQYNQGVQTVSTGQQISLPPSVANPAMGRTQHYGGGQAYVNSYSNAAAGSGAGPHAATNVPYNYVPDNKNAWQSYLYNMFTPLSANEGAGTRKPGNTPNGTTIPQNNSGGGASKPLYSPTKYSSFSGSNAGSNNKNQSVDPAMGRTRRDGGAVNNYTNSYSAAAAGSGAGPHAATNVPYNYVPDNKNAWQSYLYNMFTPLSANEGAGIRNPNNMAGVPQNNSIGTSPYTAKGQAGYYSTGPNERKVVTINGQQVRLGPNSSVSPDQQQQAPWWWPFQQNNSSVGGNLAGVRGAIPNSSPYKGAMPVQNRILQGQVYGGVSDPNAQQAFTPQPDRFSYAPNGYNSYTPYARSQPNPYLAPASNAHIQPIAPAPFMTQSQHLMGSSNPMYTGAPFMTSMQALNGIAKFNTTPQQPQMQSNFKTGQEAFQQGGYRPSKRWWIRTGNNGGGNSGGGAIQNPVTPPELIQGINWRV